MENKIRITCVSLNFEELNKVNLDALKHASLANNMETINHLKAKLSFPIDQLAMIKKCNAVMLLVIHTWNADKETLYDRLLSAWDSLSDGGITDMLKKIKIFDDEDAIKYLGECAAGLHSVVVGDSQVYSQIYDSLKNASESQRGSPVLDTLASWLQKTHATIMKETGISSGNASMERLACDDVAKVIEKNEKVAILGLGKSGQLITKILTAEKNIPSIVIDRTEAKSREIASKYKTEMAQFGNFDFLTESKAVVMALEVVPGTVEFAAKLTKSLKEKKGKIGLFVDLSSPPLMEKEELKPLGIKLVDITDLSQNRKKMITARQRETNKVRDILAKSVPAAMDEINAALSKSEFARQRQIGITKLSKDKLAVLKARDVVFDSIRSTLHAKGFSEVQTPYIIGITSDPPKVDKGGAFAVDWPGGGALLRQSPQLYKQIVVVSGQKKMFEIGPFWRAEEAPTIRHLEESIGLDIEMANIKSLEELYDVAYEIIDGAFKTLKKNSLPRNEELKLPRRKDIPIMEYGQAVELLNKKGFKISYGEDLGILGEAKLGDVIKKEKKSDIFIIQHYPTSIKKFYTIERDDGLTETFDIVFGGWELISGALRETRAESIKRRMRLSHIDPEQYSFYLNLVGGALPHGGFGMGLDRLMAKLLGLENIRDAVLFPRTFEQLVP